MTGARTKFLARTPTNVFIAPNGKGGPKTALYQETWTKPSGGLAATAAEGAKADQARTQQRQRARLRHVQLSTRLYDRNLALNLTVGLARKRCRLERNLSDQTWVAGRFKLNVNEVLTDEFVGVKSARLAKQSIGQAVEHARSGRIVCLDGQRVERAAIFKIPDGELVGREILLTEALEARIDHDIGNQSDDVLDVAQAERGKIVIGASRICQAGEEEILVRVRRIDRICQIVAKHELREIARSDVKRVQESADCRRSTLEFRALGQRYPLAVRGKRKANQGHRA